MKARGVTIVKGGSENSGGRSIPWPLIPARIVKYENTSYSWYRFYGLIGTELLTGRDFEPARKCKHEPGPNLI